MLERAPSQPPIGRLDLAWSRPGRAERAIAWSRAALAAFALGAIWLDPDEPVRHAAVAYFLLLAYVGYSLALLAWASSSMVVSRRLAVVAHGVDLAVAVAINYFTGSDSPFFVLFVFLLIAATLRWQYRGTAWTALAALGAYVTLGIVGPGGMNDPGFELYRFLMRCGYLLVTAGLLGSLGSHLRRLQHDLGRLASRPAPPMVSAEATVSAALEHAAGLLGGPRLALVVEETEEPWVELIVWHGEIERRDRLGPEEILPLVHTDLEGEAFLCPALSADPATVVRFRGAELVRWSGAPLRRELACRLAAESVLALPVEGELVRGRLFALDKRGLSADDLVVGRILGQQVAALLDAGLLAVQLQRGAAASERIRLARELHDGITQAITGAALQLGSVRRLIERDPQRAAQRVDEIQDLLLHEHRELRLFIDELRPAVALTDQRGLGPRLEQLAQRIGMLWSLEVAIDVDGQVAGPLVDEVYRLVQEAVVNAARHAGASRVTVRVRSAADGTRVVVEDDGRGFAFQGALDLRQLVAQRVGPASIKERVQALRGDMVIRSGERGSALEMALPEPEGAAW